MRREGYLVSATIETLALLKSIDGRLAQLVTLMKPPPTVDLDGAHGDPTVNATDPRDWAGDSMKGRRFSECPAIYLDLVASRLDYFADKAAEKNELTTAGKPREPLLRLDAARARGWAARIRGGWKPAQKIEAAAFPSDAMKSDEIEF